MNNALKKVSVPFNSFVFLGEIFDGLKSRKYKFYIDRKYYETELDCFSISGLVSSHEIFHLFSNCGNDMHSEVLYGLECTGADQRSYLHHIHIIGLRDGKVGLFYQGSPQLCDNTPGFAYFDTNNY